MTLHAISPTAARVLIIDGRAGSRAALRRALAHAPGLAVVGEAADVPAALRLLDGGLHVDVVGLDARAARPDLPGAIVALNAPVVLMRIENTAAFVAQALAAGAAGIARKDDVDSLIGALSDACASPRSGFRPLPGGLHPPAAGLEA